MSDGYVGKMLFVNLSSGDLTDEPLDETLCRDYIGGYGIGARILFDRQKAGVDPLGPDNILGFVTGPLTGTPALSGSRYTVVGKSPLTGGWGDANSGGDFGPNLKFAGYDAVFFTGISPKPVYLFIKDGQAELRDAGDLWGKDSFETEDLLISELGKGVHVACIGPSGEKLSLISGVMNNKGRAAGRSGLGAVMGSKKLKAIAVTGSMAIPLADEAGAKELRKKTSGELFAPYVELFQNVGTPGVLDGSIHSGDAPVKNWGGVGVVDIPDPAPLASATLIAQQTRKYACWRCPLGCGGHMEAGTGEYKYEAGAHKPEYETLGSFGTMCLNTNLASIIKANDICNRAGLDTISAGCTIAFAIECYENGIITKDDTGGIELTWGNHQAIVAMTEQLAERKGFGDVLADGVKVAAEKIGKGADQYAMHIHGQEVPMHDPKLAYHYAVTYRADATPGRHTQGSEGGLPTGLPVPAFDPASFTGRGEAQRLGHNMTHVMNAAGMCMFMYLVVPSVDTVTEFLKKMTGWDLTTEELVQTGDRIANLRQAFNIREGLNLVQFNVSGRFLGQPAQEEGPLAGVTIDEDTMIKEYLAARDWDPETAKPSKNKLAELGLADVAEAIGSL